MILGNNPLNGPNDDRFGTRFPGMNKAYDKKLRTEAKKIACELGIEDIVREGVYAICGGPNYETIAELKMLQMCGADAVGMSTVHEVITAVHCGLKVFAFSLITNACIMDYENDTEPNHVEVMQLAKERAEVCKDFVTKFVCVVGQDMKICSK